MQEKHFTVTSLTNFFMSLSTSIGKPLAIAITALLSPVTAFSQTSTLDGATGNIFKFDLKNQTFELLKATEFAPQSDIGKSRFTVHWTDQTTITQIVERTDFAHTFGPYVTTFQGLDAANVKALEARQPFEARVAIARMGAKEAKGVAPDLQSVEGMFTPDPGPSPRGGKILIDGKEVAVTLRKRNAQVFIHAPLTPTDLATGFWKTTIHGKDIDGRFTIDRMDVTILNDPRELDDPKLPRVLVIGDSISMNYDAAARVALKGIANYHRNEGNSMSTAHGVVNTELWLGNYYEKGLHWDVIQFNHGLHDLKQTYDAKTDTFGAYSVPLEEYKKNLEKQIAILQKTGAQLIWCSTTPIPNDNKSQYARRKGANKEFNDAALEVMKRHPEILINDLAKVVEESPVFDKWRTTNDVHFYQAEEQILLGKSVAAAVRKALDTKKNQPKQ